MFSPDKETGLCFTEMPPNKATNVFIADWVDNV
jgi:hypothetical protein